MNALLWLIWGILIIALLVLFLPTWRSRTRAHASTDRRLIGPVFRDDDRYWYGGIIYNNRDDPEPVVPKRYGYGWTLNFGHPVGKLVLIVIVLLLVGVSILSVLAPSLGLTPHGCHPTGCYP